MQHRLLEIRAKELVELTNRFNEFTPKFIKYVAFSFRRKMMYFMTGKYFQKVQIPSLKSISRLKGTDKEKVEMAMDDDVKVFCSCPDFLYSGQKYMAWQTSYGTDQENRSPDIRNPKLNGSVCKHLVYLLQNLDNYSDNIVDDMDTARGQNRNLVVHDKSMASKIKTMGLKKGNK